MPRWCVTIVLVLVAMSIVHASAFHPPLHRDCLTCQTLHALSFALLAAGPFLALPAASRLVDEPTDLIRPASLRSLRPLRAPPAAISL